MKNVWWMVGTLFFAMFAMAACSDSDDPCDETFIPKCLTSTGYLECVDGQTIAHVCAQYSYCSDETGVAECVKPK